MEKPFYILRVNEKKGGNKKHYDYESAKKEGIRLAKKEKARVFIMRSYQSIELSDKLETNFLSTKDNESTT